MGMETALIAGAGMGVTGLVGGLIESEAKTEEARRLKDLAKSEADSYEAAQQLLQKSRDEAITDIEAANLRQRGLITDAQEAQITSLNATEGGAINTLKEFASKADEVFASSEELAVKGMIEAGILSREDIKSSAFKQTEKILQFNEKAKQAFEPYKIAGKRGLERQQFLSGLLTEEERESHLAKFGEIEGSPLFKFRLGEAEKAIERRQKVLGKVFSGEGAKQLLEEGALRISAEEAERQAAEARGLAAQGLTTAGAISGIEERTGLRLADIEAQRQQALTQGLTQEARDISQLRFAGGARRGALSSQLGLNIANLQFGAEEARQRINQNALLNRLRTSGTTAQQIAGIRTGTAGQVAGLLTGGVQRQTEIGAQRGQLLSGAQTAPFAGLVGGLGSGAQLYGYQQGLQGQQGQQFPQGGV